MMPLELRTFGLCISQSRRLMPETLACCVDSQFLLCRTSGNGSILRASLRGSAQWAWSSSQMDGRSRSREAGISDKRESRRCNARRGSADGFRAPAHRGLVAEKPLPGRHSYFLGNNRSKWRSDVPLYGAVRYREIQPGVDVRAREKDGHFEFDLLLEKDPSLEPVEIAVDGIERMHIDSEGTLILETLLGPVRMPKPLSWETGPSGERELVSCEYVLRGAGLFGFVVTTRRPGWGLVVDPGLVWSTFLGGNQGHDEVLALAHRPDGTVIVTNRSCPPTFRALQEAYQPVRAYLSLDFRHRDRICFTQRFSAAPQTTRFDLQTALAVDSQGSATIAGFTNSTDFPTTPGAFDTSYNGPFVGAPKGDAFVARLSPTGSSLLFSTYLGGPSIDKATAIAVDAQGATTVVGWVQGAGNSPGFPTTAGAFMTAAASYWRLRRLCYSTFANRVESGVLNFYWWRF